MAKRGHPNDRAERLRINEEKRHRRTGTVETVLEGSTDTVHSRDEKLGEH